MQEKDNYLKNAELGAEQNYNMIDGILNNEPTPVTEPGPEPPSIRWPKSPRSVWCR